MFVMGGGVKGSVYGNAPNLGGLNSGNLTVQQDFRQVYAAHLQDWLGFDPTTALPYGPYQPTPLFPPPAPTVTPPAPIPTGR